MCTHPLKIKNNSVLREFNSPRYYTVPCGHCPECLKKNRDSYELRAWYEFEQCKKVWPFSSWFFLTLTYNNDNIPFYVDDDGQRRYCADFSDVQKMLKLLRNILNCGIRYFAVVEFGERRGRVHYHMILITEHHFDSAYIIQKIREKCWCRYDGKTNLGSRGYIDNVAIKMDFSIRKDYNCIRYICKYLTKYDSRNIHFTKSQSLRVRCSLGFGLGPQHENPFTEQQLATGFVFLPYSTTNRYYIPAIYYNSMKVSYDELIKNSSYADYANYIETLLYDRFYNHDFTTFSFKDINDEVESYLYSKRFPTPLYQSIRLNRLVHSFSNIIDQIPNLYLSNYFKDFDERFDYIKHLRAIAESYTKDDLLDCMLYVLPRLDRDRFGYFLCTGPDIPSPDIYCDVVFLFNCLTSYIKFNQSCKHQIYLSAQSEEQKKTEFYQRQKEKDYYEQINLSKAPSYCERILSSSQFRCEPRRFHYPGVRCEKDSLPFNLSSTDCPY